MNNVRIFNRSLPQMLNTAQLLLYLNGVLDLVFIGGTGYGLILPIAEALGAFGLANEKKWGYWVALVGASLPVLFFLTQMSSGVYFSGLITILIRGMIIVFLLHPQSRDYQKLYFA